MAHKQTFKVGDRVLHISGSNMIDYENKEGIVGLVDLDSRIQPNIRIDFPNGATRWCYPYERREFKVEKISRTKN